MTDRQHPHGEIEEEIKPKVPVNVIQVSASAGAAVTSAIAASFFGVGGTLAGAAFGSIVSSVAGALYTESLHKAQKKVVTATAVVVQRFPGDIPQAESIHRMASPTAVPAPDSLSDVGREDTRRMDVEHVEMPVGEATQAMGGSAADGATRAVPLAPPAAQPAQSLWRRPGFIMAGISLAGFLIALFFIVGTESVIGHPISGGSTGTTLTRLVSNDTPTTPSQSPAPSTSTTPPSTPTPSVAGTATPVPTGSATPSATGEPGVTSTDTPATDDGSGAAPPTDQPQSTDGSTDATTDPGLSGQSYDDGGQTTVPPTN